MSRIDAHQHFWQYSPQEYSWIGPEMALLRKAHLPEDLAPLLGSDGIGGTVAVQARQTVSETAWLLQLADRHWFIRGVVGWADLCGPDLRPQLERFSAHPKFRGVRHVVQDEPDVQFMLREDFQRGLATLQEFGLTYDLLVLPRHLPVASQVLGTFPDQPFVLDHTGKPPIKDRGMEPWASDIRAVAVFPSVVCKFSGIVTEADWNHWQPADLRPYLDVVFEAFTPSRIMFGSDWPVCTVAGTYAEVINVVLDYVTAMSEAEQWAIWTETAESFYGLYLP